jgi:predicted phage-related endonuclease
VNFTVVNVEQGTTEWHLSRAGRVTSSRANAMLTEGAKGKESAGRRNLRVQLALEQIAGRSLDSDFASGAMARGTEREPDARRAYEAHTGDLVMVSGFLQHTDLMAGASLDGYIGDFYGLCEFKCPEPSAHLEYLSTGEVPLNYYRQITHQLFISGAAWCDFASWCPEFPEKARLKVIRVSKHQVDLSAYELALRNFLGEVAQERARIERLAA